MTNPSVNRMGLCRVVLTFSSDDITQQVKIYSESEVPERPKSEKRGKEGTCEPGVGEHFNFICTGVCGHRIGKLTHPQTKAGTKTDPFSDYLQ